MSRSITISLDNRPELVKPAARTILGAIDLGDGGTEKQRHLLQSVVSKVWERPDLDINLLTPLSPAEAAEIFDTPVVRRRLRKFLVLFEFCRHPFTAEQVELVDSYESVLGDDGHDEGLHIARDFVREGLPKAIEDVLRVSSGVVRDLSELSIVDHYSELDMQAPDLADELRRSPARYARARVLRLLFPQQFRSAGRGTWLASVLRSPRHVPHHRWLRTNIARGTRALRVSRRDKRQRGELELPHRLIGCS